MIGLVGKFRILASAGPMDKILKDERGNIRSFTDIMYDFYSWDARRFIAERLEEMLRNPQVFRDLPVELQKKLRGVLILELVTIFCESAEDLAAFGISFATELYKDALAVEDVWTNLAKYKTGDIVNFYRDVQKRGPEYFVNLHGFPPLKLQRQEARRILFRSSKQLAAYMGSIADAYQNLRELHNAYKHGMRVFFATLQDESEREVPTIIYIDDDAGVKSIPFPADVVDEIYNLCRGIGQLLGAMLYWHKLRLKVAKSGSLSVVKSPVFGKSADKVRQLGTLFFPNLFDLKGHLVSQAEKIVIQKSKELSNLPRGHFIAIDVDCMEILPFHAPELSDVVWQAMKDKPGARLVFRRILHFSGRDQALDEKYSTYRDSQC